VLDEVLSQLAGITSDVPTLTALLESSIRSLELTLADVEKIAEIGGEAISDLKAASDDISLAFGKMSDSLLSIESGLTLFKEAININDKDAAKASLDKIADGISTLVSATDEFALSLETVSDILDDAKWVDKSISEIDTLAEIFVDMSEYLSALYEATTDLSESIEVDWSKMTEAADELSGMIGHLADAVKSLGEALTLMESGIETVSEGLTIMGEAITVNDQAALENATKQIADGISETVVAFSKMSEAMGELSEIMGSIDASDSLVDIFSDMSASLGDISDAGVEMSEAML
jgi:methyl-accepting chemotaxis protein